MDSTTIAKQTPQYACESPTGTFWRIDKKYVFTLFSGIALLLSWMKLRPFGFDPAWVTIILSGLPILSMAMVGLFTRFDVKAGLLVSIALVASVAINEYFAAGEVAFIMMLGELLEEYTLRRSREAVSKLVSLIPHTARVRRSNVEEIIPVEEIEVGDRVLVMSGETIPVDGIVSYGTGEVNQSAITGESVSVVKNVGDEVFIGSLNELGAMEIEATKVGQDTTLARVIKLVKDAQESKAPIQRIADKWATILVPMALSLAIVTYLITGDVVRGVTILIVFCPCALCLATPTAIAAGIGYGAKRGILIKNGAALELVGRTSVVAFDKTGTVTMGKPSVSAVTSCSEFSADEVLQIASIAEKFSEHLLGKAIVSKAIESGFILPDPDNFKVSVGNGVIAHLEEHQIIVGTQKLVRDNGITVDGSLQQLVKESEENGRTVVIVAYDGSAIGIISISDAIKPEAKEAMRRLNSAVKQVVLLTGDNKDTATAVCKKVEITSYQWGLLPGDKSTSIKLLQEEGHQVAMVGDGINDAPALAVADVGIAMGVTGTDIAVETADIALTTDNLEKVSDVIDLGKSVLKTINLNIAVSMVINLIAVGFAATGLLGPIWGALVHNAGSTLVIANAARLALKK